MAKKNKKEIKNDDQKMITLSNPELGERDFTVDHATRILNWDARNNKTNWTLHDTKLTFENGQINEGSSDSNS